MLQQPLYTYARTHTHTDRFSRTFLVSCKCSKRVQLLRNWHSESKKKKKKKKIRGFSCTTFFLSYDQQTSQFQKWPLFRKHIAVLIQNLWLDSPSSHPYPWLENSLLVESTRAVLETVNTNLHFLHEISWTVRWLKIGKLKFESSTSRQSEYGPQCDYKGHSENRSFLSVDFLWVVQCLPGRVQTISIFHRCEVRTEISVSRVTVWHHEASPNNYDIYFFLHTMHLFIYFMW